MKQRNKIAILLFSRTAKGESSAKRWTHDPSINFQIANHLISRTQDQLNVAPFPVFCVDESLQQGDTFGERLTHAFNFVFEKGFTHVISVGNDCENLQLNWLQISQQLVQQKTILGPDHRGGVYLIGVSKSSNFSSIFKSISWKSNIVFKQLQEQFETLFILKYKQDISTFENVSSNKELYDSVKKLIDKRIHIPFLVSIILNTQNSQKYLRGPPTFYIV